VAKVHIPVPNIL